MRRSASARWNGDLKAGRGTISTESGVLADTPYSFATRFENGKGKNPETGCPISKLLKATITLDAKLEN